MIQAADPLERWARVREGQHPAASDLEELIGFFQAFRPDGEGLEEALTGAVGASEVLPRLQAVYQATADGWDGKDLYFVVRRPPTLSGVAARRLAEQFLRKLAVIARAAGDDQLRSFLEPVPRIELHEGPPPTEVDHSETALGLFDVVGDYAAGLTRRVSDIQHLWEAAYAIANDQLLQIHVLWPLLSGSEIDEPFEDYFELWRHGVGIRFDDQNRVVYLYLPTTEAG